MTTSTVDGGGSVDAALRRTDRRRTRAGRVDVVAAAAVGVLGVVIVTLDDRFGPAALGMLLVGLPLLLRTREPRLGLAALVVGAAVNGALFGDRVRCGAVVPALALLCFAAARRSSPRSRGVVVALTVLVLVVEFFSDPVAAGGGLPDFLALAAAALGLGFLTQRRDGVRQRLEQERVKLEQARRATLEAAAVAERLQIATGIEDVLDPWIHAIVVSARAGLADPDSAAAELQRIEDTARSAIAEIRVTLLAMRATDP